MDILKLLKNLHPKLVNSDFDFVNEANAVKQAIEYMEKQEPVAWLAKDHSGAPIATSTEQREHIRTMTFGRDYWVDSQPLFTHPKSPKLRKLSDEEICKMADEEGLCTMIDQANQAPLTMWFDSDLIPFARRIEAAAQEEVK